MTLHMHWKKRLAAAIGAGAILVTAITTTGTASAAQWDSGLTEAQKQSSYGFFTWLEHTSSEPSLRRNAAHAVEVLDGANAYTKIGDKNDATYLTNVDIALDGQGKINIFRSNQRDEPCRTDLPAGRGRKCNDPSRRLIPLLTSPTELAWAERRTNESSVTKSHVSHEYAADYSGGTGENLAFGHPTPLSAAQAWYGEKDEYDAAGGTFTNKTGHYINLTNPDYQAAGTAVSAHGMLTTGQFYVWYSYDSTKLPIESMQSLFEAYCNTIGFDLNAPIEPDPNPEPNPEPEPDDGIYVIDDLKDIKIPYGNSTVNGFDYRNPGPYQVEDPNKISAPELPKGYGYYMNRDGSKTTLKILSVDVSFSITYTFVKSKPAGSSAFTDVSDSTAHHEDIAWLATNGITTGMPDGSFGVGRPVNRQDMAAFLRRLAKLNNLSDAAIWTPTEADWARFNDVNKSTAHAEDILWLAHAKVTSGYDDGSFHGTAAVQRQDMAAFLHRLAALAGKGETSGNGSAFSDVKPSTAHREDIAWLSATGITTGMPDGSFGVGQSVQRQDMAAFLHRLHDKMHA